MRPVGFGARLALSTWLALSAVVALAAMLVFIGEVGLFGAAIWALLMTGVALLPAFVVSLVVGTAGWAWARRRAIPGRAPQPDAKTGAP